MFWFAEFCVFSTGGLIARNFILITLVQRAAFDHFAGSSSTAAQMAKLSKNPHKKKMKQSMTCLIAKSKGLFFLFLNDDIIIFTKKLSKYQISLKSVNSMKNAKMTDDFMLLPIQVMINIFITLWHARFN